MSAESNFNASQTNGHTNRGPDKANIADLVAKYGSTSATAWLEFERYDIWQAPEDIPGSSFRPIQGYMRNDSYIFAWGNPLVSDSSALEPTARAFISWVESLDLKPVWACVGEDLQHVLGGQDSPFGWSTVSCIHEEIIDPEHIIDITESEEKGAAGGPSIVKDLRKNLKRAENGGVEVREVAHDAWTDQDKKSVEEGIEAWKASRSGPQIASTSGQPWLDVDHRRYWLARHEGKAVGILVLTPINSTTWQIKNAVSFPSAPKGTSEAMIVTALKTLRDEHHSTVGGEAEPGHVHVTFGISAADTMNPVGNLSGWRVTALSKAYGNIAKSAGLLRRGEFRRKFDPERQPMYVCYPQDGLGLHGVNALIHALKQ